MRIIFSSTSSKGNTSVIESRDGHLLIIDAGIKYKTVDKEIGYRLHNADAILITHCHKDHTHYMTEYIYSGIRGYISKDTVAETKLFYDGTSRHFSLIDDSHKFETEGFKIVAFDLAHTNSDGSPCECYGFLIYDKSTGEKMLWATDTQYIKNKFPPLDFYCIECNYFEQDDYNDDLDYIEKSVEKRRVQSHMSFESLVKFLKLQDLSKCKEIRLLHLSSSMLEKHKKKLKSKLRSELKSKNLSKDVKIYD